MESKLAAKDSAPSFPLQDRQVFPTEKSVGNGHQRRISDGLTPVLTFLDSARNPSEIFPTENPPETAIGNGHLFSSVHVECRTHNRKFQMLSLSSELINCHPQIKEGYFVKVCLIFSWNYFSKYACTQHQMTKGLRGATWATSYLCSTPFI